MSPPATHTSSACRPAPGEAGSGLDTWNKAAEDKNPTPRRPVHPLREPGDPGPRVRWVPASCASPGRTTRALRVERHPTEGAPDGRSARRTRSSYDAQIANPPGQGDGRPPAAGRRRPSPTGLGRRRASPEGRRGTARAEKSRGRGKTGPGDTRLGLTGPPRAGVRVTALARTRARQIDHAPRG